MTKTSPSKKRGRPLGSKNKPKKIRILKAEFDLAKKMNVPIAEYAKAKIKINKAAAASRASFKQAEHQRALHNVVDENLRLIDANKVLTSQVENLKHQVIGFRAVISYLENHLNLRSSQ